MVKKTAFITIGEAPRDDIKTTYDRYFSGMENVVQTGLLDGLSYTEADQAVGLNDEEEYSLISRFQDGSSIVMSREKVEKRLQEKITDLEQKGYERIVLLCTGTFQTVRAEKALLIEPEKLTIPLIKKRTRQKRLGVMVPLAEQIGHSKEKWGLEQQTIFAAASPYHFKEEVFSESAHELINNGAEVIILDCMGYNDEMQQFVQLIAGNVPVVQSNDVLFQEIAKLI